MAQSTLSALSDALTQGAIRVIDITQPLSEDTPLLVLPEPFGQTAAFRREEISRYDERGVAWHWNNFTVGEHSGTHFDAPIHWVTGKDLPDNTVDRVDPKNFVGPAVVVDCSADAAADPDFLLSRERLEAWEAQHGRIPEDCWVLMRTDWSKRSVDDYTNRKADGAHTPGPDAGACRFLIEERNVRGFGVETIGTDAGQAHLLDPQYPAHSLFHGAGKFGLQCLQNLDRVPATGAMILAAPLKIVGGSGSPLRVLALVAD